MTAPDADRRHGVSGGFHGAGGGPRGGVGGPRGVVGGPRGAESQHRHRGAPHQRTSGRGQSAGGSHGTVKRLKLRQRERLEIAELKQRIILEIPQPGKQWEPPSLASLQQQQQQDGGGENDGSSSSKKRGNGVLTEKVFADLPLSSATRKGLSSCGFSRLTHIQAAAIPHALAGRDVKAQAKTGSGKTLAFVIPILERLFCEEICSLDGTAAIVLTPTRELAVQIFDVFTAVGKFHEVSIGCLIGGKDVQAEAERIGQLNIVVATPGRLLQHIDESPMWDASRLLILAIDEADRLVDLGFQETIELIISSLPSSRQTLLFSATLRSAVQRLGMLLCSNKPEYICTDQQQQQQRGFLKQSYMVVAPKHKTSALFSILRAQSKKKIIVFVSSCKQAKFIHDSFKVLKPGISLLYLHGRQKQQKRLDTFQDFVSRTSPCCLISTDLAARGIDFVQQGPPGGGPQGKAEEGGNEELSAVDFVVQFDCPDSAETHVHRVGRTARFTRKGNAVLLLLPSETEFINELDAKGITLQRMTMNPKRAIRIESKLQSLLASDSSLKALAQQAVASYLRCLSVMPNKKVFNITAIDLQQLALCYGLSIAPSLDHLAAAEKQQQCQGEGEEGNPALCGGAVASGTNKKKNMSKLARLKEQIRAKKLLKQQRQQQQQNEEGQEETASSKKHQRQQQCVASSSSSSSRTAAGDTDSCDADGEDLLQLTQEDAEPPEESGKVKHQRLQELLMRKPAYKRERLQFRSDGTAKVKGLAAASANSHIIFHEEEVTEPETDSSERLNRQISDPKVAQELRDAFLQQMRHKMQSVQQEDKARDQQRVRERHQKKRKTERLARRGDAATGSTTVIGRDSSESDLSSEAPETDEEAETLEGDPLGKRKMGGAERPPKRKRKDLSVEELERLALQAAAD